MAKYLAINQTSAACQSAGFGGAVAARVQLFHFWERSESTDRHLKDRNGGGLFALGG
jgi:hypothetical protein